jgi:DNA repair protein RecO (recombination protein O)
MLLHTQAVVLSRRRLEETSSIVQLYTAARGKISTVAKAARRPLSHFGSALEPGSFIAVTIYHKENRDLHLLSSAEILTSHSALREKGELWAYLASSLELVEKLTPDEDSNQAKFILLTQLLESLPLSPQHISLAFRLRFIAMSGFALRFGSCISCGRKLAEHAWYHPERGGFVCAQCYQFHPDAIPISGEVRGILSYLSRCPLMEAPRVKLNTAQAGLIDRLLNLHLRATVEINLRTQNLVKILEGT